jgi:transaldolase
MANPLRELNKYGQSVWYDDLNRKLVVSGTLQRMVEEDGVSGGTSNPSIFEKAISGTDAYDEHLRKLVDENKSHEETYDELTTTDVGMSADHFRPIYNETQAKDGYASLEVAPLIANDTQASIEAARRLFAKLDKPNAMIKIPGTPEGLPAIEQCLADGLNINITLLFGVENYEQVAWAYVSALEKRWAAGQPIDRIGSVASFFVSRVDTLVDQKLQEKIERATSESERQELRALLGKAAVANAKIAYAKYKEIFSSPRWMVLAEAGAKVQRCLWASTSTKNPEYRDVMYVEPLIGPDTINTMPLSTLEAFRDHGVVKERLDDGIEEAFATIRKLEEIGIDFRAATDELQVQGVKLFSDSFAKANESIKQKREALVAERAGARS